MRCAEGIEAREVEELFINLDPIQAGGRLTPDAMKAVIAYGDGYSVCDNCRSPFRLDTIRQPPVDAFHRDLSAWLNMDETRVVPGARRGFQAVAQTFVSQGDPVLLTSLSHYTAFLAVEEAGGIPREILADAGNIVTGDAAADRIEDVRRQHGKAPGLLFIDHFDYQYGNEHQVREIARIAHQYDCRVVYNGAYSVGILPVDGKEMGVDFIVGSGHKSMAAPAPSGLLSARKEFAAQVFRTTKARGDVTGRKFGVKEVEMMGCTLMGVTLLGMMASFPHVKKRVLDWKNEVARSRIVTDALRSIDGTRIRSEYPRKHTLTRVDTTASFDTIAQRHKKKGYFLASALKERGRTRRSPGSVGTRARRTPA